jgi:hypothetical protein
MTWARWGSVLSCLMAIGIIATTWASPALADEAHTFNARLSLTGGCETSVDDPVPDPPVADCPSGVHPPDGPFANPTGIATDSYGDVYVASHGPQFAGEGRIDVFDAEGNFLDEINEPNGPQTIAVDTGGHLYVWSYEPGHPTALRRYDPEPSGYEPSTGNIDYNPAPTVVGEVDAAYAALSINPENNHLFVNYFSRIAEYGSADEGNTLLNPEVASLNDEGSGLAVDAAHGLLYATNGKAGGSTVIKVFELGSPHNLVRTIDCSSSPAGNCGGVHLSLAVDEETGNLFVYEQEPNHKVSEFTSGGTYLSSLEHNFQGRAQQIVVDNGVNSPNGVLNLGGRFLWVSSAPTGTGHAYAFGPRREAEPKIEAVSFSEVGEREALLEASVQTGQLETSYRFEYTSLQQFEANGFANAQVADEATLEAGEEPVEVSAEASGLAPGTEYVFRVIATNELGDDEAQSDFRTYQEIVFGPCPNDALRIGPSAALPDCRAYELVTPGDTNARSPMGVGLTGAMFPALPVAGNGNRAFFRIEGGLIPGSNGTGSLVGDPYSAARGTDGWTSADIGGSGSEATTVLPGGRSPDGAYTVWVASGQGPAVIGGEAKYLRYPDGHSELVGRGALGSDPHAEPELISEGGGHVVFLSNVKLEEGAKPPGGFTVYDRTADGVTHVVSLLPGELTPSSEQSVEYRGSSLDGRGIAFTTNEDATTTLYLRHENQQTYEVADGVTFEGVAEGGKRVFYLKNGSLFAFDIDTGTVTYAGGGDVTVVNVSADGSAAYFVSPDKLTGKPNPLGEVAKAGKQNLYLSREGAISLVGIVTEDDVVGEGIGGGGHPFNGLGLWAQAVGKTGGAPPGTFSADPSRSTGHGTVLLFQSAAQLTAFDTGGTRQIYRYDSEADELSCVSCNPSGAPATGGALLQNVSQSFADPEPNGPYDFVQNLSSDGRRAFFQSTEPLVAADTDGLQDVYEWEAPGRGSCDIPGGCLYLISSGHSGKVNYLYGVGDSGDDVFFRTSDLLVPADIDATPSLYDARVNGGFPESLESECQGEGCRPGLTAAPALAMPGAAPSIKSGNLKPNCPRGRRRVMRHGRFRCVKKHHRHHHGDRAGKDKKGGRK